MRGVSTREENRLRRGRPGVGPCGSQVFERRFEHLDLQKPGEDPWRVRTRDRNTALSRSPVLVEESLGVKARRLPTVPCHADHTPRITQSCCPEAPRPASCVCPATTEADHAASSGPAISSRGIPCAWEIGAGAGAQVRACAARAFLSPSAQKNKGPPALPGGPKAPKGLKKSWSERLDSNQRPLHPQCSSRDLAENRQIQTTTEIYMITAICSLPPSDGRDHSQSERGCRRGSRGHLGCRGGSRGKRLACPVANTNVHPILGSC